MSVLFDLDRYLTRGVEEIVASAVRAALKNPRETAFLIRYAVAAKKAAALREMYAHKGRHVPSFLIASITSRCNLHCAGCYARANRLCHDGAESGLLTDEEWDGVFAQAQEIGVSFILLAGGEPMLRRGVLERAAAHKGIVFPVFTNGTLLDGQMLALFDRNRNLVPILSMEGNEAQTDARRGAGVYALLADGMRALTERGVLFGASITVTKENIARVTDDAFLSVLKENGCKIVFYVDYVPSDPLSADLAPGDAQREYLEKRLETLRARTREMVYVSFPGDEKLSGGCLAAGRGFFHINARGGAEPCPFSPFSDTSVRDVPLLEALDSPLFRRLREGGLLTQNHNGACVLFEHESEVRGLCAPGA